MGSSNRGAALVCLAALWGGAVWASAACSSSPETSDGGDAATEAGTACGPGPYASITGHLTSLTTNQPVEGATITLDPSPCPSLSATTDSNGTATVLVTIDAAVNPRIERAARAPTRAA